MSRGEGIALSLLEGTLYVGKSRSSFPRARNAAEHLQKLVDKSTYKTRDKNVLTFPLVDAPEEENRHGEKYRFLADMGDKRKEKIAHGVSQAFKKM